MKAGKEENQTSAHRLVPWSLGAGLCALIPIPFLDDWAMNRTRSAAYRAIWKFQGVSISPEIHEAMLTGNKPKRGCFGTVLRIPYWIVKWLIFYPIKKILHKILFFFTIHDAVNAVSDCYHRCYLLNAVVAAGHAPQTEEDAYVFHDSIEHVCATAEARPVIQLIRTVLKRGNRTLRREAMCFYRMIRKNRGQPDSDERLQESVDSEAVTLTPIAVELENRLLLEKGYFDALAKAVIALLDDAKIDGGVVASTPPPIKPPPQLDERE
jgi:hypothetical protein